MKKKPWWSNKWGSDSLCGITHSRLRPGKNKHGIPLTITLKCLHRFYTGALLEWANKCSSGEIPTCPLCRCSFNVLEILINSGSVQIIDIGSSSHRM